MSILRQFFQHLQFSKCLYVMSLVIVVAFSVANVRRFFCKEETERGPSRFVAFAAILQLLASHTGQIHSIIIHKTTKLNFEPIFDWFQIHPAMNLDMIGMAMTSVCPARLRVKKKSCNTFFFLVLHLVYLVEQLRLPSFAC